MLFCFSHYISFLFHFTYNALHSFHFEMWNNSYKNSIMMLWFGLYLFLVSSSRFFLFSTKILVLLLLLLLLMILFFFLFFVLIGTLRLRFGVNDDCFVIFFFFCDQKVVLPWVITSEKKRLPLVITFIHTDKRWKIVLKVQHNSQGYNH